MTKWNTNPVHHDCNRVETLWWRFVFFAPVVIATSLVAGNGCGPSDGDLLMYVAAAEGRVEGLSGLVVNHGANVNARDKYGQTPMFVSARNGHVKTMAYLKQLGADVSARDQNSMTPMFRAAECGQLEAMKWLKEQGADANARTHYGLTPMHLAAGNGHLNVMKWLKEQGANINAQLEGGGWSPMTASALSGHAEAMKWLHEQGVELPPVGLLSSSLARAAGRGDVAGMAWLKEHGAELHYEMTIEREQGVPVLSKIPLINRFFSNRGMVHDSVSAMTSAARYGQVEAMAWLKEQGADVNTKDYLGHTPLFIAAERGHVGAATWLVQNVDVNDKVYGDSTPMFVMAAFGLVEPMALLQERGVDVNGRDDQGMTPMFWAAGNGQIEAMAWLKEHGADVNAKDNRGATPLSWTNNEDAKAWLLANGAKE